MMKSIANVVMWTNRGVVAIGAIALSILPLIVFYDVVARYLFNAPTIWATEVSIYILQMLVFLPMGVLVSEGAHVRSTLLLDRISSHGRYVLQRFGLIVIVIFAVFVIKLGWQLTIHAWSQSQTSATLLAVPLWIPNSLIPIGGVLLLISAVGSLLCPVNFIASSAE